MSWRPWTAAAKRVARLKGHKRKPPEPIKDWKIVRGDLVEVLSGRDKGKQGEVCLVARRKNSVMVEGTNTHLRRLPSRGEFPGGNIMAESLIHVTNVALVDPEDNKPCKVIYKYLEDGSKVRVSKRSGCVIPKPPTLPDRKDFKSRSGYIEGLKDTKPADVIKVTYVPSLTTFEEDIDELYPQSSS